MDESTPSSNGQPSAPGISIRHGPVGEPMDIDQSNGNAKRKSRGSVSNNVSYKDDSDSDEAAPLVRETAHSFIWLLLAIRNVCT